MLDNNLDKDLMLKITNLKEEELNKIIENINQDEAKSDKQLNIKEKLIKISENNFDKETMLKTTKLV